jgi:hypothetical protein
VTASVAGVSSPSAASVESLLLPARGLGEGRESLVDNGVGSELGIPDSGPSGVIHRFFASGYRMIARRAITTRSIPPSTHHTLLPEGFISQKYALSPIVFGKVECTKGLYHAGPSLPARHYPGRRVPLVVCTLYLPDYNRNLAGALSYLARHSRIFQKESLRVIFPSANSSKSTPRTSIFFPDTDVPVRVHSETPKSPHAQC